MCFSGFCAHLLEPIAPFSHDLLQSTSNTCKNTTNRIKKLIINTTTYAANTYKATVEKITSFVVNNWKHLLVYAIAWTIFFVGTGIIYGFQAVAFPLLIGFGCGSAVGVLSGVILTKFFDPKGKATPWNLANEGMVRLPHIVLQMTISVIVTVVLAATVIFPYAMGAALGVLIGYQVASKIQSSQKLGKDPARTALEKDELENKLAALRTKFHKYEEQMQELEKHIARYNDSNIDDNTYSTDEIDSEN